MRRYGVVLVALAAVVIGCAAPRAAASGRVEGSAPAMSSGAGPGMAGPIDLHAAATVEFVERVLAQTPDFPGAVRLRPTPKSDLDDPPGLIQPPTLVRRTAWWTSPMSSDQFHEWLRHHLPTSWASAAQQDDPIGTAGTNGFLEQYVPGPRSDAVWTYPAANVYWEPRASGILIRVSAQADWVATRPAAELIPDDATEVEVSVLVHDPAFTTTGDLPPTVHRSVRGADAVELRELINSRNPWTDTGLHGCLATFGMTDVLVFHGGSSSTTITAHDGGCTGTDVVQDGRALLPLEDRVVHDALVEMLGLPSTYATFW